MKVSELQGAMLDYYVARAEGVPADQLEIRHLPRPGDPRTPDTICVRQMHYRNGEPCAAIRIDYSTNWALAGPLLGKRVAELEAGGSDWRATVWKPIGQRFTEVGDTPLIAICRAVVRAAFGYEVEDLP